MDDQRIATILWRGRWILLACVAVGVALALALTASTAKTYQALATIEVVAGGSPASNATPNDLQLAAQGQAQTDATLIGTMSFLDAIRRQVAGGRLTSGELAARTSAKAVTNTSLVQVTATGPSPEAARRVADGVSTAFVRYVGRQAATASRAQQSQIQKQLSLLSKRIRVLARNPTTNAEDLTSLRSARASLQTQLAGIVASGIAEGGSVRLTAPASASSAPIRPRPLLNLLAGLVLGLLIGIGLAWARARLDRGLRSVAEAEQLLDVPVLATVPLRRDYSDDDPVLAEAFDVLRTNLAFVGHGRPLRVVLFTSFNPQEGKSSTVAGLAQAAARAETSVVVVDADTRKGSISARFGHGDGDGLTSVVIGAADLDDVLVEISPGVTLLPCGPTPPNPASLLAADSMQHVLEDLRSRFPLVLVDAPPVAHLADAALVAASCDGVVLLGRVGVTDRTDLADAAAGLRHIPTPVVGMVILEKVNVDDSYYPSRPPARLDEAPSEREPAAAR